MRYQEMPCPPPMPPGDQLPVERISPRARLQYASEGGSLEALAESIRRCGLLRPVTVRKTGYGRYVIVSGNRRLMACRMLGLRCISAHILADDAQWQPAEVLMDALLTRRMHYLAEAEALRALCQTHGTPPERIAAALSIPTAAVEKQLRLTEFGDELRALLMEECVPLRIALVLLRLPDDAARLDAATRIARERLCIRDSALLVNALLKAQRHQPAVAETESRPAGSERPKGRRVISVIRDQRLFLNAIRNIAGQMQAAGFRATVEERRNRGQLEMTISVPMRRRRAARYQSM